MNEKFVNICGNLVFFIVFVCGLILIGALFGANEIKKEAIRHNVAEYYLDTNNTISFRWKQ